jgi:hypothetical protein
MEETFHINIEGYPTDQGYISISKVRLWPAILASLQWMIRNPIPGHNLVQSGIGLIIINNLAISVEGFIADMIIQKIDNNEENKPPDIQSLQGYNATWKLKIKLYNKYFDKKLESYSQFKAMEILFLLSRIR